MREKRFLLKDEETGDLVCEKYCGKDCPVIFDNPVYNEVVVGGQMRKYLEDYPLYLTEDEEGFYDFNADLDYRTGADEETGESIIDNTDRIPDYSPVYDNDEIAEAERVRAEAEKKCMWLSNSAVIKPALIWEPVRVRLPWLRNEPSSFSVDYNKMSINSMPVLEMNKCC